MMKKVYGLTALAFVLTLSIVGMNLKFSFAQEGDENLPTLTPYPVENVEYELTTVGGTDETLTFPGLEKDGFVIGETTLESNYPRGLVFTVTASSANGDITDVTLFMTLPNGFNTRFAATLDKTTQTWVVKPWENGEGQPAWTHFDFTWHVSDEMGASVDTEPATGDYWDPVRQWYRMESDYIILYWFGLEEVAPEYVAENIALAVAATEPSRIEGFGEALSYKPIGVVYPSIETLEEMKGNSDTSNSNNTSYTNEIRGVIIEQVGQRTGDWFERQKDCVYRVSEEENTEQRRVDQMIFTNVPYEMTRLYRHDKGVEFGPTWWVAGQGRYFAYRTNYIVDERLRHLGTLQDMYSLQTDIPAFVYQADGCDGLAFDMGQSFINWLLTNYGGLETHTQVVALMTQNVTLPDALEQITGKTFFDLENEWRVYLGFPALTLADIDPALALVEPVNAIYVTGDAVVFPGPAPINLAEKPGANQIPNATCFAGIEAKILRVGNLDGINYYEIDCQGSTGWVAEEKMPIPQ
jgi:hypothetical protein